MLNLQKIRSKHFILECLQNICLSTYLSTRLPVGKITVKQALIPFSLNDHLS